MYHFREMKGLTVFSLKTGKDIGRVDGLVVDPETKRVQWLSLNSGGRYEGRHWISMDDVRAIDRRGIQIDAEVDIRAPEQATAAETIVRAGRRLVGRDVVTERGQPLGRVRDYEFDPETRTVRRLIIPSESGILGNGLSIDADHIVAIAENGIIVAEHPAQRERAAAPKRSRPASRSLFPVGSISALWRHAHKGSG